MENVKNFLETAINIAKKVGEIQLKYFRTSAFAIDTKSNDYDVVTTADKESEALIVSSIRELYPSHGIVTEESGTIGGDSDYIWVIDPLDGTTNFSQGLPIFSVSIALELKGKALLGVVYAPYLQELFYAVKGGGAYYNDKEIKCSVKNILSEAVVSTGFPYDKFYNSDNNLKEIVKITPLVRGLRRMGSAAIDLCYVAAGFLDAYWELNLNHWDVAAASLIAEEAGALQTAIRKNRKHSILVSCPGIFEEMVSLLDVKDFV